MFSRRTLFFSALAVVWIALLFSWTVGKAYAAPPTPTQIADINTTQISGEVEIGESFDFGGVTYIRLKTLTQGWELWHVDDSGVGVTLVKNLNPGIGDGVLGDPVVVGNSQYFAGSDGGYVVVWRFDGVNFTGVELDHEHSYTAGNLTVVGSVLYLVATERTDAAAQSLWRVDGTTASRVDIALDQTVGESFINSEFMAVGSLLYLSTTRRGNEYPWPYELWQVQGTSATQIEINNPNGSPYPRELTVVGNALYLSAIDGAGDDLWEVKGAKATKIKIYANGNAGPRDLTVVDNTLYLTTFGEVGKELWQVVGSTPTKIDIIPELLTAVGNALYVNGNGKWWRVVGTTATPFDFSPGGDFIYTKAVGDSLYVQGNNPYSLWQVNGTTPTKINFNGGNPSYLYMLPSIGDRLYFYVEFKNDFAKRELWQVEGTTATKIVIPSASFTPYEGATSVGVQLWILARVNHVKKYFTYDGHTAIPLNLPFSTGSMPSQFVAVGDALYFTAFDGTDTELWRYGGSGVEKIDFDPSGDFKVVELIAAGNAVYFSASHGYATELWQVSGTTATRIDVWPYGLYDPLEFAVANNTLYVSDGSDLWRVVGTEGAKVVINPGGLSSPDLLTAVGDALYLRASDDGEHSTIWRVEGSTATKSNFNSVGDATFFGLTSSNGTLFFIPRKYGIRDDLWQVQGTNATRIQGANRDIEQLSAGGHALYLMSPPTDESYNKLWLYDRGAFTEVAFPTEMSIDGDSLTFVGNRLYLRASADGETELWQVEGATATKVDINKTNVNHGSSDPEYLTARDRGLYLSAFDGTDRELWLVTGTNLHKYDIFPGEESGEVSDLYAAPNRLYFAATGDLLSGAEAWAVNYPLTPQPVDDAVATLSGVAVEDNVLGNDQDPQGDALTVASHSQAAHGQVTLGINGDFTYTSASGFSGVDFFTYTVGNSYALSATATTFVVVKAAAPTTSFPTAIVITPNVTSTYTFTQQGFTISIEAPADAYSGTLNSGDTFFMVFTPIITPTDGSEATPGHFQFAGLNFTLESYLDDSSVQGIDFATPLIVEIEYPASAVVDTDPAGMSLLYWDAESESWKSDGIQVLAHDLEKRKITVAISHLTEFALFVPSSSKLLLPLLSR